MRSHVLMRCIRGLPIEQERTRIEGCGGQVKDKRALGDLIPSRTLGDIKIKRKCPGAVIAIPEFSHHELQSYEDISLVSLSLSLSLSLSRLHGIHYFDIEHVSRFWHPMGCGMSSKTRR
jgi:hypothetical protein